MAILAFTKSQIGLEVFFQVQMHSANAVVREVPTFSNRFLEHRVKEFGLVQYRRPA